MSRIPVQRPSAGMAVAFVALLVALSGSAVALPGKNKVDSGDIKNGNVKSADIKNSDVRSGDVKNNTLTGSDVDESKLGKVPTAGAADTAGSATTAKSADTAKAAGTAGTVNGVAVRSFNFTVPGDVGDTTLVANFGGLALRASCSTAVLGFDAIPVVAGQLDSFSVDPDSAVTHNYVSTTVAPNDVNGLVADDEDFEVGETRFTRDTGGGVVISWHAAGQTGFDCAVSGTMMTTG